MAFQLAGVSKSFKQGKTTQTALSDINLQIPKNSFFGIVGGSGAGKSTLLRLLNLLERPDSGSIHFYDQAIIELTGRARRQYLSKVATVFQHFNLFHSQTVSQNIELPLLIRGVDRKVRQLKVAKLIELVGLQGKEQAYPSQLSGGQKQRVGIARALVCDAEVLLCDEATSALDSETTSVILDLLLQLKRTLNLTIILITHSWDVVRYAADSVTLLQYGRVTESGKVVELLEQTDSYLGRQLLPAPDLGHPPAPGWVRYDLIFPDIHTQGSFFSDTARQLDLTANMVSGGVEHLAGQDAARFKVDFDFRGKSADTLQTLSALLHAKSIVLGRVKQ